MLTITKQQLCMFTRRKILCILRAQPCAVRYRSPWSSRDHIVTRLRLVWAAQLVQRNWRGHASRQWFQLLRRQQAACGHLQRVWRGAIAREQFRATKGKRHNMAALVQVRDKLIRHGNRGSFPEL